MPIVPPVTTAFVPVYVPIKSLSPCSRRLVGARQLAREVLEPRGRGVLGHSVLARLDLALVEGTRHLDIEACETLGQARLHEHVGLVGEPPMHYVARWRMHVALTWLKEDDAGLGDLAIRLGYQSEAAFSRAFKRFIGVSPGAVRRNGDAANNKDSALSFTRQST
jgi:AraC-like DNA-binding protein